MLGAAPTPSAFAVAPFLGAVGATLLGEDHDHEHVHEALEHEHPHARTHRHPHGEDLHHRHHA